MLKIRPKAPFLPTGRQSHFLLRLVLLTAGMLCSVQAGLSSVIAADSSTIEASEFSMNDGAFVTISSPSPDNQASDDQVALEVTLLGWDISLSELRRRLRDKGFDAAQQRTATLGFRSKDRVLSFAYTVVNRSDGALTLYGRETLGLGDLPMVVSSEDGPVRLLVTPYLDPNVDFDQLPYISGSELSTGEERTVLVSLDYPLEDSWKLRTFHDPDELVFCVGLTAETDGMPADALGHTGAPGRYWPMGGKAPIMLCQTLTR